jgi:hypothetical protein
LHYFYNTLIATIHKGKISITFQEMWGFSIEELDIFNKTQEALSKLQDFMHQKAQQQQNMKQFN